MIEHLRGTVISSSIQNESAVTAQRWLMDYKNRILFLFESDNDVVNDTVVLIRINIINLHVSSLVNTCSLMICITHGLTHLCI